ncbi:MAG TPA: amidohydrolase family protein [Fimbriimonadaceae bacterium]|nr:amidohydrolase family protein [Fimbriimonadaceae bacterium]
MTTILQAALALAALPTDFDAVGALIPTTQTSNLPYELEADRIPTLKTGGTCYIEGGIILTGTKGTIRRGSILVRDGKIVAIGPDVPKPPGVTVIDARNKVISPGIVDAHVHRGIETTNEGTDSITAEVRIGDLLNPTNRNVWQAAASGETTGMALHGSANAIGGQSQVIKFKYGRTAAEMKIPDAPRMIKFALGENVTRSGSTTATRFPRTRMGQEAVYRRAFEQAKAYMAEWDRFRAAPTGKPPRTDLRLEALADILRGKIWVQCHSYRADEMLMMTRLSQEYGFKIGALQHALEGYKIAPELAKAGVGVSIFVDNWSFKIEGYDAIPYNAAICHQAGVNVSINTDGTNGTTALAIDAAKVMRYGGLSEEVALQMITINPARQLGIDQRTGSLEVGKDADIVLWDGHPLSVYSKCAMTLIDGEVFFKRRDAFGVDAESTTKDVLDARKAEKPHAVPKAARRYALTGGTVHTVSGSVLEGATVLVEDGVITAVGERLPIPRDAVRVDVRGKHVYPGLIDAGTSLGLAEISPIGQTIDNRELGEYQPDLTALTAFQIESAQYEPARCNGVLAAVTKPIGGTISGRAAVVKLDGWTWEDLAIRNPGPLCINFPGGGGGGFGGEAACCDEIEDLDLTSHAQETQPEQPEASGQVRAIEEWFTKALDYAKQGPNRTTRDLALEAMLPYAEGKELVLIRVRNAASIRDAVAFIKRNKLKAALTGAPDAWKEAKLLADSRVPVIIAPAGRSTLGANTTVAQHDPYDTPYALPALLQRVGVKFCFQSDDNSQSMSLPFRVGQHCAYGLSPAAALRACTLSAAEILGVADRLGSIEAGKVANLFVTTGDAFEPTSQVSYVFIAGKPVPLESKHTRLRDKYLKRLNP